MSELTLRVYDEFFSVCRLNPNERLPQWASNGLLTCIVRSPKELSIVCPSRHIPIGIKSSDEWRAFEIQEFLEFFSTGVLSALTNPLSKEKISVFAFSTFDTDFILVKNEDFKRAMKILAKDFTILDFDKHLNTVDLHKLSPKELGMLFPIEISDYNDDWPSLFKEEKEYLKGILGERAITIEHFGSTAIPGLSAKPTIDILVEVSEADRMNESIINVLKRKGYEFILRKDSPPPYMHFVKGYSTEGYVGQCYHIHMAPKTHSNLWDRILFRDFLKTHPKETKEYERLKGELALKFKNDRELYTEGKEGFVRIITERAKQNTAHNNAYKQ